MYTVSLIIILLILIGLVVMWKGDYPMVGVIILTNIVIFGVQWMEFVVRTSDGNYAYDLGFRAQTLVTGERPWTLVTNLYVHGGLSHVLGNMLFLFLLGMPFEDRVGGKKFVMIYFSAGIGANILNGVATLLMNGAGSSEAEVIGIGASAAIFGVMGAFTILYPRDEIPMFLVFIFLPRVPVIIAGMIYGLMETALVELAPSDNVGHLAHVCGFILGVFIGPMIAKQQARTISKTDNSGLRELLDYQPNLGLKNAVENIISTDIPEVREAWWEELLHKGKCPKCGKGGGQGGLGETKHGLRCGSCGYSLDLRRKRN